MKRYREIHVSETFKFAVKYLITNHLLIESKRKCTSAVIWVVSGSMWSCWPTMAKDCDILRLRTRRLPIGERAQWIAQLPQRVEGKTPKHSQVSEQENRAEFSTTKRTLLTSKSIPKGLRRPETHLFTAQEADWQK